LGFVRVQDPDKGANFFLLFFSGVFQEVAIRSGQTAGSFIFHVLFFRFFLRNSLILTIRSLFYSAVFSFFPVPKSVTCLNLFTCSFSFLPPPIHIENCDRVPFFFFLFPLSRPAETLCVTSLAPPFSAFHPEELSR